MYKRLEKCVCCNNENLFEILDLNEQPLANNFHNLEKKLEEYELKILGCSNCYHVQLSIEVDPSVLFRNYLYVSGTSNTLRTYFDDFANKYNNMLSHSTTKRVLDIACNDGSQLDSFKKIGWTTFGVDPAENLHHLGIKKGHFILNTFWNDNIAKKMPKMDLIIAQNVLAHTADPKGFLESCVKVMHNNTLLVIQTSQADMFINNEFDTIYHEHISYFSIGSMIRLSKRVNLNLKNVYKADIHGNSYVFEFMLPKKDLNDSERTINDLLLKEQYRNNKSFYISYAKNTNKCLFDLGNTLIELKNSGKKIIGYGAAAKGMTVINAGNIELDYIIDDNPLKQGLFTPGKNIPIYDNKKLTSEENDIVIVPLAWNFYDEIKANVKKLRPEKNDIFIKYFPKLEISQ